jgi:hypothetical protein
LATKYGTRFGFFDILPYVIWQFRNVSINCTFQVFGTACWGWGKKYFVKISYIYRVSIEIVINFMLHGLKFIPPLYVPRQVIFSRQNSVADKFLDAATANEHVQFSALPQ